MAPVPVTDDYYLVLEVQQTATSDVITRSYRRLALKLHPDRNPDQDTTKAFQLLGKAYETLKDDSKRREYDLIYHFITRNRPASASSIPKPKALSEAAQIMALQKSKHERRARWLKKESTLNSSILEFQMVIRQLEQEIKSLDSIVAAERSEEVRKNSWGTWLLSPLHRKAEYSDEEKALKDRKRQERRIEKNMKERRLGSKTVDLDKEKTLLRKAREELDAADSLDDGKIQAVQYEIRIKIIRERRERERVEKEQQEKRDWEEIEAIRKQKQEEWAGYLKRQEEQEKKWEMAEQQRQERQQEQQPRQRYKNDESRERQSRTGEASLSTCHHDGWWSKVQGRTACPKCNDVWNYLLQCPRCETEACPRCQSELRSSIPRHANRKVPRPARGPKPSSFFYD